MGSLCVAPDLLRLHKKLLRIHGQREIKKDQRQRKDQRERQKERERQTTEQQRDRLPGKRVFVATLPSWKSSPNILSKIPVTVGCCTIF